MFQWEFEAFLVCYRENLRHFLVCFSENLRHFLYLTERILGISCILQREFEAFSCMFQWEFEAFLVCFSDNLRHFLYFSERIWGEYQLWGDWRNPGHHSPWSGGECWPATVALWGFHTSRHQNCSRRPGKNHRSLTLTLLRLRSSKGQGHNDFWKASKLCHIGIHWKALAEFSQMRTHLAGFQ